MRRFSNSPICRSAGCESHSTGQAWIRDVFPENEDDEGDEVAESDEPFVRMSAEAFETFVDTAVDELSRKQDALILRAWLR